MSRGRSGLENGEPERHRKEAEQVENPTGTKELMRSMEARANGFNLKCLAVLCGFDLLCKLCNDLGVFTVDPFTMNVAMGSALLAFLLPIAVWLIHDRLLKKSRPYSGGAASNT